MRGAARRSPASSAPSTSATPTAHQPGTGHVPFAAIVATLREIGFDGVLSVECRLRGEPREAVRACGRYLRGVLAT